MRERRLDIQGLRAIAVLLVLLYHLWPSRLTGGYVGVDVFYVISGFLITTHLLGEITRTGTISVTTFWARRARRLLPVAFIVLGFCIVVTLTILPSSEVLENLKEIGASTLYVQNWLLASNSTNYLGADLDPTLVQHFWSLSVEEQFYAAWPLLMLAAIGAAAFITRRRPDERSRHRSVLIVILVVFFASLTYSILETRHDPQAAYFITSTRAWELAAGGLIAFLPSSRLLKKAVAQGAVRLAMSWGGLAFIAFAALTFTGTTDFPGYAALLPVLGASFLIIAGEDNRPWSPQYLLSFGPAQFLGDISYSVYLWHWPLVVLYPALTLHPLTLKSKLGIIVATGVLATLTKYLVEDPVRRARPSLRRRVPSFAFMAAGLVILLGITGGARTNFESDLAARTQQLNHALDSSSGCFGAQAMLPQNHCGKPFAVTSLVDPGFAASDLYYGPAATAWRNGADCMNDSTYKMRSLKSCEIGDTADPTFTMAVVGDSHAQDLLDALATYAKSEHWAIAPFTYSGCGGLEKAGTTAVSGRTLAAEDPCYRWGAAVRRAITDNEDIDAVVFSNRAWQNPSTPAAILSDWAPIEASGKKVVAIQSVPEIPDGVKAPDCVATHSHEYDPCAWTRADIPDYVAEAAQQSRGDVPLVQLDDLICSTDNTCHAVIGGVIVYLDDSHFTLTYSRSMSHILGSRVKAALAAAQSRKTS